MLKNKKYVQKQLHIFFTVSAENIRTCVEICRNLSMIMKNIFDGWFKKPTALYECHRPRNNAYRIRQIIRACFARMSQLQA